MSIQSSNPATGEVIQTYEEIGDDGVHAALDAAVAMQREFGALPVDRRARWLLRAAGRLADRKEDLARLMTSEMGKTLASARAEVEKCEWVCRFYAERGAAFLADERIETGALDSRVRFQPLGVVLAIMPWNFPLWQVFRFAAPALVAGNAGLLKHASNVPGCALAIESILHEAGFPPAVFRTLLLGARRAEALVTDPRIDAVTLTGSEPAGRAVAAAAGKSLKKTVLELGGSDPYVVLDDADLEAALRTAVRARTINNGQSCIAAKRFIVTDGIAAGFEDGLVQAMSGLRVGDPMSSGTDIGPLATEAIREELHAQVTRSVEAGAVLRTGGEIPAGAGYFYPPTVLTDVPRDCPVAREETFGPVAPVFRVRSADEALELANDTGFGLGAAVWTGSEATAARFTDRMQAGSVFVNAMVASDPRLPFGGIGRSGYGRELGVYGLREFLNIKTVWIGKEAGS